MVAPGVSVVMDMALLPLFWIVGVATCEMTNSFTAEDALPGLTAMAFTVVVLLTENVLLYAVLEAVGVPPSVV